MAYELLLQEAQGMSEAALMEVVRFMKFIKSETGTGPVEQPDRGVRRAGTYRGEIRMAEDFDAPLKEFGEYMS